MKFIPGNVRYQTGLIKLLSVSEAIDSIEYGYKDDTKTINKATFFLTGGLISNNKLISSGCFFTSVFFADSVRITGNEIFPCRRNLPINLLPFKTLT